MKAALEILLDVRNHPVLLIDPYVNLQTLRCPSMPQPSPILIVCRSGDHIADPQTWDTPDWVCCRGTQGTAGLEFCLDVGRGQSAHLSPPLDCPHHEHLILEQF